MNDNQQLDPTPEQIQRRSAEINAKWSERTRRLRAGEPEAMRRSNAWTVPIVHASAPGIIIAG